MPRSAVLPPLRNPPLPVRRAQRRSGARAFTARRRPLRRGAGQGVLYGPLTGTLHGERRRGTGLGRCSSPGSAVGTAALPCAARGPTGAGMALTLPTHRSPGNTPLPFVVNTVINIIIWFNI